MKRGWRNGVMTWTWSGLGWFVLSCAASSRFLSSHSWLEESDQCHRDFLNYLHIFSPLLLLDSQKDWNSTGSILSDFNSNEQRTDRHCVCVCAAYVGTGLPLASHSMMMLSLGSTMKSFADCLTIVGGCFTAEGWETRGRSEDNTYTITHRHINMFGIVISRFDGQLLCFYMVGCTSGLPGIFPCVAYMTHCSFCLTEHWLARVSSHREDSDTYCTYFR